MHQESHEETWIILLVILVAVGVKYSLVNKVNQAISNFSHILFSIINLWKVYLLIAILIIPFLVFLVYVIRKLWLENKAKNNFKIIQNVKTEKTQDEFADNNFMLNQNKTEEIEDLEKQENNIKNKKQNEPIKNVAMKALPKRHFRIIHDFDKGFYKKQNLSDWDINKLKSLGYKEIRMLNIYGRAEYYLIRPRFNESLQHCFLTFEIAEYIKKFTDKIWIYETVRPDIIFVANNKKHAIEIETGKVLQRDKNKFLKKIENLNSNFKNNWFFVVTDRNIVTQYKKFGKTYDKRNIKKIIDKIFKNRWK